MLIKTTQASRRSVMRGLLNGAAVTVSLPFLSAFLNDSGTALAATGEQLPSRFGTWFWGLGIDPNIWEPKGVGALSELPDQLKAIDGVKQHINVFTNFDVLTEGKPNFCHFTGWVTLRCGIPPDNREQLPGPSLDTAISDFVGDGTRFRSLQLAATGEPRDSYSFQSADAINPPEISPVEFYRKIFGVDFQDPNSPNFTPNPQIMVRKSVLSGVSEQRAELERQVGAEDKARLDQYYTAIREVENRLALQLEKPAPAPNCKAVTREPNDIPNGEEVDIVSTRHRAMTDLLVMALACNQSKVFNMVYSDGSSALTRKGYDKSHHAFTHEEPVDPVKGFQPIASSFLNDAMKEWSYFVEKLANTPEGDGSLLDRSLIYAHSDCQVAKMHSLTRIPMMTAGKLNGRVKTGLHIDGKSQPATLLGFTVQRLMGLPIDSWGRGSNLANRVISEIVA